MLTPLFDECNILYAEEHKKDTQSRQCSQIQSSVSFDSYVDNHVEKSSNNLLSSLVMYPSTPSEASHQLSSSSPTRSTDVTILGYGLAAMDTKPEAMSAPRHARVVASSLALPMGLPGVAEFVPLSNHRKHLMGLVGRGSREPLLKASLTQEQDVPVLWSFFAVVTYVKPVARVC